MAGDADLEKIMHEKMERMKREIGGPIALTDSNFDSVILSSEFPVVVDFWAEWCMPCKAMESVIDIMQSKYGDRIVFGRLNVDETRSIANRYEVFGIPTLILFQGGVERERIVGVISPRRLGETLTPYIS